jgi:hypothetical protein
MGKRESTLVPWWLDGSEHCAHCLQVYVLETEYRCTACDGATCPQCAIVVRERREVHCPACGREAADGGEGG